MKSVVAACVLGGSVLATQSFEWATFWSNFIANVGGAAVGAIAAFVFAIWLARLENQRERRERQAEFRETNLLSVKATVDACAQNLEELVNFKGQMVVPLAVDSGQMDGFLAHPDPAAWASGAATLQSFFKELQTLSFAEIPHSDRFAFALDEVPSVTSFVHRAATSVEKVNASIELRNDLVRRWADVARGGPVSADDMGYFFRMLSAYANAIASNTDDALFFHHLLHDQCYYIGLERFSRPSFRHVVFPADKANLIPASDYLNGFRDRLERFGFSEVSLTDESAAKKEEARS